jgi:hypothetical protein
MRDLHPAIPPGPSAAELQHFTWKRCRNIAIHQYRDRGVSGMKKLIASLVALTVLPSCSASSADKKVCEAKITENLLNPETAKFFDFSPISKERENALIEEAVWVGYPSIPKTDREQYRSQLQPEINEAIAGFSKMEARPYSVRVKADSKLGLTVTTNYFCAATDKGKQKPDCLCHTID